jgi:hypothetical protein
VGKFTESRNVQISARFHPGLPLSHGQRIFFLYGRLLSIPTSMFIRKEQEIFTENTTRMAIGKTTMTTHRPNVEKYPGSGTSKIFRLVYMMLVSQNEMKIQRCKKERRNLIVKIEEAWVQSRIVNKEGFGLQQGGAQANS